MANYCISVDWLQVYCNCNYFLMNEDEKPSLSRFTLKKRDVGTSLWKSVFEVFDGKIAVATICANPRSSVMQQDGCTLKLENRVLYSMQYMQILNDIMSELNMRYVGISRMDVCYDCNTLKGGKSVRKFLTDYVVAQPYQEGHIIRNGSRKFAMHAKRAKSGAMEINSMRWGSQASDIGAYCYNKSLEMLEVKEKPWIIDTWEKNGIRHEVDNVAWKALSDSQRKYKCENGDSSEYIHNEVWRFEISIKAHGKDILNLSTGELFRLSTEYLSSQANIEKIFYVYAQKVFDFRMSQGQKTIREYPKMDLFERRNEGEISSRPYRLSVFLDSGRGEKMCYNKLMRMSEEYADLSSAQLNSIQSAMDFVLSVAGKKASIVRLKRQEGALRSLRANKFIAFDDYLYIGSIEAARLAKREISASEHYSFMQSLIASVEIDALRQMDDELLDGYPYGL